jgi:hypothetical protein
LFGAGGGQDGHGGFGQVIEHQKINQAGLHQLRRTHAAVAPKPGGTAYANHFAICHPCTCEVACKATA